MIEKLGSAKVILRAQTIAAHTSLVSFIDQKHKAHVSKTTSISIDSSIKLLSLVEEALKYEILVWDFKAFTDPAMSAVQKKGARVNLCRAEDALKICQIAIQALLGMNFVVREHVPFVKSFDEHPWSVEKRFEGDFRVLGELLGQAVDARRRRG